MNEELKNLDIQMIATVLFIVSLCISLFLTYNSKTELVQKKPIIPQEKSYQLSVFNRIFVLILSLVFLYVNISDRNSKTKKGNDPTYFNLQVTASELSCLAALIVLYVVIKSGEYAIITSVENPSL